MLDLQNFEFRENNQRDNTLAFLVKDSYRYIPREGFPDLSSFNPERMVTLLEAKGWRYSRPISIADKEKLVYGAIESARAKALHKEVYFGSTSYGTIVAQELVLNGRSF